MKDFTAARELVAAAKDVLMAERTAADPWMTADDVEIFCSACADKMRKSGIQWIRSSVLRNAKYPDSAPTEQDRKKWREEAEERRRKEGVKPRKGSLSMVAQWDKLPKGWTEASMKAYWKSLTGSVKHKVTKCMKRMEGTSITDPGAFCASLADHIEGKEWRSE
jgi:hypothetical protein